MKKIKFLFVGFLFLLACKPGIPENVLQPEKMVKVLYDIHLVDGYISTISVQDSAKIISAKYYKTVYKKHQIDSAMYNRSLNYYYKHPDVFAKIYTVVSADLDKQKKVLETQQMQIPVVE
ncbi:MAG: DUF4296 domain-containing protein [Sphingobacteriaceae bacterium]|nr:DUF4296 domain-containing protein [Sphingobacteriaceae bacterium]